MNTVFKTADEAINALYKDKERQKKRFSDLSEIFRTIKTGDGDGFYFSAPGRIEIIGNHTDHQKGCVLTAAIDKDILAIADINNSGKITVNSTGQKAFYVYADDTTYKKAELGKSIGMVRGIAAAFRERGCSLGGADIVLTSDVPTGSGISSSAAFEILIATVLNELFNDGKLSPIELAIIGQYAESRYFGKPCGLMDQCASAHGGCIKIDFKDSVPKIEKADMNCISDKYDICIVHTGGSHAKLNREYASIVEEMLRIAKLFGKRNLREVDEDEFMRKLPQIRETQGDRAALRALHFFRENARTVYAHECLQKGDCDGFIDIINSSGDSSVLLLQNVYLDHVQNKSIAFALSVTKDYFRMRGIKGACRIHGGGFMGTILAFIPHDETEKYMEYMDGYFGEGATETAVLRSYGGIAMV